MDAPASQTSVPPLLEVTDLSVVRTGHGRRTRAVSSVTLSLGRGERLGILGESGCGKSTLGEAILGLFDRRSATVTGSIRLDGRELLGLTSAQLREVRGRTMALIFQDALSALTPVMRVGDQIAEMFVHHEGLGRTEARAKAVELLEQVGVPDATRRARQYPHEFSGGMRQRALIAMSIALAPPLLIADEPTTALDTTVQKQILALLQRLHAERGMAIVLITHDVGVIAKNTDRVAVMYAGRVVELAPTASFMAGPAHPYARGLLSSLPQQAQPHTRLPAIPGQPPRLDEPITGCAFAPRCPAATDVCRSVDPTAEPVRDGDEWQVACHHWREAAR